MKTKPHSRRWAGWCLAIAAAYAGAAAGAEIAVLTPAYSKRLDAELDTDVTSYLTFGLSEAARNTTDRATKLNKLAADTGFDAIGSLQKALLDQFAKVNRTAEVMPIVRRARIAPLARDEVPENASAKLLLDISIHYLGIYGVAPGGGYEPAVLLEYRWVDPAGGLAQSTRRIRYNPFFLTVDERDRPRSLTGKKRSTDNSVVLKTAEGCHFRTFDAVREQHQKVWGCMELAFGEIAATVAVNIPAR